LPMRVRQAGMFLLAREAKTGRNARLPTREKGRPVLFRPRGRNCLAGPEGDGGRQERPCLPARGERQAGPLWSRGGEDMGRKHLVATRETSR